MKLAKTGSPPAMLLLDIPNEGGYYLPADGTAITLEGVRKFLDDHKEKRLPRKQLGEDK